MAQIYFLALEVGSTDDSDIIKLEQGDEMIALPLDQRLIRTVSGAGFPPGCTPAIDPNWATPFIANLWGIIANRKVPGQGKMGLTLVASADGQNVREILGADAQSGRRFIVRPGDRITNINKYDAEGATCNIGPLALTRWVGTIEELSTV